MKARLLRCRVIERIPGDRFRHLSSEVVNRLLTAT
jgi:hypothetical protein